MARRRGRPLEGRRGLLVGPGGCRRQVPRAPVEVVVAAKGGGQHLVCLPAQARLGGVVDGRPQQRVGELQPTIVHVEGARLGERAYEAALAEGRTITMEQAVAYAIQGEELRPAPAQKTDAGTPASVPVVA